MSAPVKFTTKLVLSGEPEVGKSALRRSYLGKSFKKSYLSTLGADFSVVSISIEDGSRKINAQTAIWDLAGQSRYEITYPKYFRGAQANICVYDITNRESFNKIDAWVGRFKDFSGVGKVVAIVANKTDLISEIEDQNSIVTEKEHSQLIDNLSKKFINFLFLSFRTSAKTGDNIQACVNTVVSSTVSSHKKHNIKDIEPKKFKDYILASYITSHDDINGASIVKKSPNYGSYSDKEFIASFKVATTNDFESLGESPHVSGSLPWNDPQGIFHYFAFVNILSNSQQTFIIGFVNAREIDDLIMSRNDIILGFFHKAMNDFNTILKNSDRTIEEISASTVDLDNLLHDLRVNVFRVIESLL